MKKILFVCAASKMVLHFRTDLIKKYQSEGYSVSVVTFDNQYCDEIKGLGVDFYCVGSSNRSLNPFEILSLKNKYVSIMKKVNPDVVFTFMLKPNIYGVLAAKKAGVKKIFSMVEGAGDAFTYNTLKWRLIRRVIVGLYRKAFKIPNKVFFLNGDDVKDFIKHKIVKDDRCELIKGIGVNLDEFRSEGLGDSNSFLMVARLNVAKGVIEYCNAARIVKKSYPNVTFGLLGAEGNLTVEDIKEYIDDGSIIYHGVTDDVRPYLRDCGVCVLPSYREGFSVSIMEAEASGKPIITCDAPGCKDAVREGYNGFLVPVKDVDALAEKMIYFINNPDKVTEMGKQAREFAETYFDYKKINDYIFDVVEVN